MVHRIFGALLLAVLVVAAGAPASLGRPKLAAGLPDGVPAAATRPAPALPAPVAWPFPEAFPHTSGTGRLAGGAFEWSDFIYDDHGAQGITAGPQMAAGSTWTGTYTYEDPDAHGNGADLFRLGIGLRDDVTYWRVDWTTLEDPDLPIAAFGLADGPGPLTAWPAGAGVSSAGLDATLVVSARGAWLDGARVGDVTVEGRSFVAAVPRSALPAANRLDVWAVSGVANDAGDGFAPVDLEHGARPGQPAVYNAAFRDYVDEGAANNAWYEDNQAATLAAGDITRYSASLDWAELAAGTTTPEPRPTGHSNRWYLSSVQHRAGIVTGGTSANDATSTIAGPIVPYGVYVPDDYDPSTPAPLTWTLHSLGYLHNQYAQLSPKFLEAACNARGSICASPSGRSGSNPWYGEAELDLWEIWRDLAQHYTLDPDRTVLSGYSMGGLGTFRIGLAYPSVFTQAVAVAPGLDCGVYVTHGVGISGAGQPCMANGNFETILPSARWLPFVMGTNAADELSPMTNAVEHSQEFEALGYRYRLETWTAQDHFMPLVTDGFASIAKAMRAAPRPHDPGRVTFTWYPDLVDPALGLGPTSVYWLSGLSARADAPGVTAAVDATSAARPDPSVTPQRFGPDVVTDEQGEVPKVITGLDWDEGIAPAARNELALSLTNVAAVTVDGARAGLRRGALLEITSDGPATVVVTGVGRTWRVLVVAGTTTFRVR